MTSLTNEVTLRAVIEEDLPILFEHQRDTEASRMAAFPAREWEAFMAHWARILADKTLAMAIILDGNVVGYIVSWHQDLKQLVGYWIGKQYWGKGIATKALSEFLRVETHRPLYAFVATWNLASIRVLEKCGFSVCADDTAAPDEPADGVEEFLFRLLEFESAEHR